MRPKAICSEGGTVAASATCTLIPAIRTEPRKTLICERIAGLLHPVVDRFAGKEIGDGASIPVTIPRCLSEGDTTVQLHPAAADGHTIDYRRPSVRGWGPNHVATRLCEARMVQYVECVRPNLQLNAAVGVNVERLPKRGVHDTDSRPCDDIAPEVAIGVRGGHHECTGVVPHRERVCFACSWHAGWISRHRAPLVRIPDEIRKLCI